jgi:TetR/AcrR family transcriptional repressor of mexJK operon
MSTTLPPPAETSPKRAAILKAAAKLFLASGYASVSMDAVAREAGVSKATLYAHFTGKEALFGAIVEERCLAIAAEAERLAAQAVSSGRALRDVGRILLHFLMQPATLAMHRVVIAEGTRFPDLARAFYAAGPATTRAWMTRRMAEEQRHGRLRADADPAVAAEQFAALMRGDLYLQAVLGHASPDESEIAEVVDRAVEMFLRAYGTTPAVTEP